jgi:hypothetical protein
LSFSCDGNHTTLETRLNRYSPDVSSDDPKMAGFGDFLDRFAVHSTRTRLKASRTAALCALRLGKAGGFVEDEDSVLPEAGRASVLTARSQIPRPVV